MQARRGPAVVTESAEPRPAGELDSDAVAGESPIDGLQKQSRFSRGRDVKLDTKPRRTLAAVAETRTAEMDRMRSPCPRQE